MRLFLKFKVGKFKVQSRFRHLGDSVNIPEGRRSRKRRRQQN